MVVKLARYLRRRIFPQPFLAMLAITKYIPAQSQRTGGWIEPAARPGKPPNEAAANAEDRAMRQQPAVGKNGGGGGGGGGWHFQISGAPKAAMLAVRM